MKGSNSGISVVSELELATGPALRPRLDTLGRVPVGTGGGEEGARRVVGVEASSLLDIVLIGDQVMCLRRGRGVQSDGGVLPLHSTSHLNMQFCIFAVIPV